MSWQRMNLGRNLSSGRSPFGSNRQVIGACLIVSGTLLLTQVLPYWVGTLLFGSTLVLAGILILRNER